MIDKDKIYSDEEYVYNDISTSVFIKNYGMKYVSIPLSLEIKLKSKNDFNGEFIQSLYYQERAVIAFSDGILDYIKSLEDSNYDELFDRNDNNKYINLLIRKIKSRLSLIKVKDKPLRIDISFKVGSNELRDHLDGIAPYFYEFKQEYI